MYNKRKIGGDYEKLAANHLREKGYTILELNFYHRGGELDIIAKDGKYLVFVEVKYRTTIHNGYPEEAIDYRKRKSIIQSANYYMYSHGYYEDTPCRFDAVVILDNEIKVIQDAFEI
ncbi:YraN family protein [Anaeromicropila herbilytica]|uniref:UPF0102 protein bsdtb5_26090 n=1 Tax=Anaeromicropila herbilytica TaxID=2785025 RepID=A0A7R7EM18_9FIRM|nr:YraN family protein [Anaeromicropila herbilytica]BCN31314.1 UPF0102 protein [Anaeromicropila herbilytica]